MNHGRGVGTTWTRSSQAARPRRPRARGPAAHRRAAASTPAARGPRTWRPTAGATAGRDLKTVYRETYARLQPKYGQWVIFDHCMPFDVTRAYDEATQHRDPRIWTAERDRQMWETLEG